MQLGFKSIQTVFPSSLKRWYYFKRYLKGFSGLIRLRFFRYNLSISYFNTLSPLFLPIINKKLNKNTFYCLSANFCDRNFCQCLNTFYCLSTNFCGKNFCQCIYNANINQVWVIRQYQSQKIYSMNSEKLLIHLQTFYLKALDPKCHVYLQPSPTSTMDHFFPVNYFRKKIQVLDQNLNTQPNYDKNHSCCYCCIWSSVRFVFNFWL